MGKKIPLWQCLIVILAMIGLLVWSIVKDSGGEPHIALLLAAAVAAVVAFANGWKWAYLEQGILASINRSMQAILILAIVGSMIASWMAAGTIPSMMYYGIMVISPKVFLLTACILCSIVSLATGSSWSTAGSMGVALIGVGTALGFPEAMTAGAVVSGAYFGDKMSPLSDTTNLAPAMAGATLFDHIKHMIYTTGTSMVIALIAYAVMGFMFSSGNEVDLSVVEEVKEFIKASSNISIIALIPPVFVIAAVALKLPAIPSLLGGVLIGVPLMFMNKAYIDPALVAAETAKEGLSNNIFYMLNNGIAMGNVPEGASDIINELASLLSCDGMQGMMWTISIILMAMCFGGIVDCTGMMATFAGILLKVAKGRGGLVLATEFSCLFVNAVCCDQYLSLVLPGRMFKEAFEDMRLAPKNLSRCLEDSGTITSNFFPWNTCGATMRTFLGVGSGYIPYAILNWLNPIVSCIFGFTGITMTKMTDEEYQRILEEREAEKEAALKALEA
ncbi:MAG: Na+/H+ antiporter NhaC [Anaerovoracaceae bacterium]|nr:Na+/H+ antiporter NhaC [Anaerovoracaceae bacterium]